MLPSAYKRRTTKISKISKMDSQNEKHFLLLLSLFKNGQGWGFLFPPSNLFSSSRPTWQIFISGYSMHLSSYPMIQ